MEMKYQDMRLWLPTVFIENRQVQGPAQAMLPAFEAILGQRSAHSFATGPVMAEPADTDEGSRVTSNTACFIKKKTQNQGYQIAALKTTTQYLWEKKEKV